MIYSKATFCTRTINMADSEWNHTALLVIDMKNDSIADNGLVRMDGGKAILPNVINTVEKASTVAFSLYGLFGSMIQREVELFRRHFHSTGKMRPACNGSPGAELVEGLVIKEGDYKLVKTRFSAFFATHLHSILQSAGIHSLLLFN